MFRIRNSISKKLTVLNLLVSGTAVLLACAAFFAFDLNNYRKVITSNLSTQAQIIGYNCVTPLVFNDPKSAEKTLSALRASGHIIYAGVYTPAGRYFAGYWRNPKNRDRNPPLIRSEQIHTPWIGSDQFTVVQPIFFEGNKVGTVYIWSDAQELVDRFDNYITVLGVILLVSLVATLLVSRMFQRVISKPIRGLADTARIISRDKNYSIRAKRDSSPDEIAVLIEAFNGMLAEIQQRDSALKDSEQQFRTLADSVPQLAWMAEADGYIFWYNQRWYEYTGSTPEKMVGWGWQSVHGPEMLPEVLTRWRQAISSGLRFEMVFPLRGTDGTFRDFLTLCAPVRDTRGKVVRWFGTNTDITEQRRSEEALRRSEMLAATGRLAASIAHEINNPLEAVTNLLYLAKKQPNHYQKYLVTADQELERIAEITKHTLGFYRDASTPVNVDVSEAIQGVLVLYAGKLRFKKISVHQQIGDDLAVIGFPGEIRQIFANLVANAIEAMNENGCLIIKASRRHEMNPAGRGGVRVTFLDNGCGIPREEILRIFQPFYTTKKDVGTGLGLWLTQNLVLKNNGSIRVRSRTDRARNGTAFSVFLPSENAPELPAPVQRDEELEARSND